MFPYSATIAALNGDWVAMPELQIPRAHSNAWNDHLTTVHDNYYSAWTYGLSSRNGEDAFGKVCAIMLCGCAHLWEAGAG